VNDDGSSGPHIHMSSDNVVCTLVQFVNVPLVSNSPISVQEYPTASLFPGGQTILAVGSFIMCDGSEQTVQTSAMVIVITDDKIIDERQYIAM